MCLLNDTQVTLLEFFYFKQNYTLFVERTRDYNFDR